VKTSVKHKNTILYIDDEQANLDGFKYIFHKEYNVFLANTVRDAFKIINNNKIKVVISDNRMPDMLGTEFFEVLSTSNPDIIRILVTAFADTDAVMQAINKGKVYRFITKPWNKNELQVTIDNAFEAYNLKQQNTELIADLTSKNKELADLNFRLMIEVAERTKAEEELAGHRDNLEMLVKQRTEEIEKINNELAIANHEMIAVNEELYAINEELEEANKKLNHEIEIRTHVQEQLAESENKYRGLIQQSSEGVMLIKPDGKIAECNEAVGNIFEIDPAGVINTTSWEFDYKFAPKRGKNQILLKQFRDNFHRYIKEFELKKNYFSEGYQETASGKTKFISSVVFPVETPKGRFLGKIVRDNTEKKKTEESLQRYQEELEILVKERTAKLQESEQRLRTISDNMPGGAIYHGFIDAGDHYHLVYASASIVNICGIQYSELLKNFDVFFLKVHPDDKSKLFDINEKSLQSLEALDIEIRYISYPGDTRWLHLRTMYKSSNDGNTWWDGYVIDITHRKRAEKAAQERDLVIKNIQEGIASVTGEKLFETIVMKLSETLKADYTYIGELSGVSKNSIRVISLCENGLIGRNFEYNWANTPDKELLNKNLFSLADNCTKFYPKDSLLKKLQVEGYVGVVLFNSHNEPVGIMVSLFKTPIAEVHFAEQILQIFSSRVGAEMERIKTESGIKEREERFRTLFELTPNMMLISRFDDTIIECNSAFSEITGYKTQEIVGNTATNLGIWTPQQRSMIYDQLSNTGRVRNVELSFKNKFGSTIHALLSVEPVIINSETMIISTATDITERKKAEEAIQQYSDIAFNMQVALNVYHLENTNDNESLILVRINPAAKRIMGLKDDAIGKKLVDAFPDLKDYNFSEILANVVRTGHSYENEEFRYYNKNGDIVFFAVKAFRMPNDHVGLLFENITHRKRVEKAVIENEERYRALFTKSPNGIHLMGTNPENAGKWVSANPKVLEMLGYSENELVGLSQDEVMRDISANEKFRITEKLMSGETITFETNFYKKDGTSFPVEVTESILSLGDQLFVLGIDRDISERKQMENALRESERKLLNIFNSSSDGILIVDLDMGIIDANQTFIAMLGFNDTELFNKKSIDLVLPVYKERLLERTTQLHAGETLSDTDVDITHKDGHSIPVEISGKLISHGGKPAILTIVHDITERKNIEKKLFETIINTEEKEREKFAGDLHDEVGPLLSSLKMYVSLLAETEDKKKKQYIIPQIQTLIKEAITTVREISNDLSPHVLNNYGCVAAINAFIGIKRDFLNIEFNQNIENRRFNQNVEIVLYRIVKELVNNTIKHAKASNIGILLLEEDNMIKLLYNDDGIGFNIESAVETTKGNIGLLNIMSRIKTVNGKHKISSAKGTGFSFELIIPALQPPNS
jgi:PAS domain S-box-containing protein